MQVKRQARGRVRLRECASGTLPTATSVNVTELLECTKVSYSVSVEVNIKRLFNLGVFINLVEKISLFAHWRIIYAKLKVR